MRIRFRLISLFLAITVATLATGLQLTAYQEMRGVNIFYWEDALTFVVAASSAPLYVVWALTARWLWLHRNCISGGGFLAAAILMSMTGEIAFAAGRGIMIAAFAPEPRTIVSVVAVLGLCKRVFDAGAWLLVLCALARANSPPNGSQAYLSEWDVGKHS